MLTSNEKKLVYILGVVLVVSAAALFFYLRITMKDTGLNDLNRQIRDIENNVRKLQLTEENDDDLITKIDNIEEQIELERSKFFKPGEIDFAVFGLLVKNLIVKNKLKLQLFSLILID